MEIAVKDAAQRLGVNESRVRQLLLAGDLVGRRLGRSWLVDSDDVARLEGQRRRAGRPMGPSRAWALLNLLGGGSAPWLSYSARSQVRSYMARVDDPDADLWRAMLRGRNRVVRVQAHPAALQRLRVAEGVLPAGPDEAAQRGFDLVSLTEAVSEFYVEPEQWASFARRLAVRQANEQPNLIVRLPQGVWPFQDQHEVQDSAIAADLLESAEPRAVTAGARRLGELLRAWRR